MQGLLLLSLLNFGNFVQTTSVPMLLSLSLLSLSLLGLSLLGLSLFRLVPVSFIPLRLGPF